MNKQIKIIHVVGERPVTVTEGTNMLVGAEPVKILNVYREIMRSVGT
jgi:hypothetical protein